MSVVGVEWFTHVNLWLGVPLHWSREGSLTGSFKNLAVNFQSESFTRGLNEYVPLPYVYRLLD